MQCPSTNKLVNLEINVWCDINHHQWNQGFFLIPICLYCSTNSGLFRNDIHYWNCIAIFTVILYILSYSKMYTLFMLKLTYLNVSIVSFVTFNFWRRKCLMLLFISEYVANIFYWSFNISYVYLLFSASLLNISHSSQCSTTGVTKAVVCIILSGMMHIKEPLLLIEKSSLYGGSGGSSLIIWVVLYHMSDAI